MAEQQEEERLRRWAREQGDIERQIDVLVVKALSTMVTAAEELKSKLRRDTESILDGYRRTKRGLDNDISLSTAERLRLRREAERERDAILAEAREQARSIVEAANGERETMLGEVREMEQRLRGLEGQIRSVLGLGVVEAPDAISTPSEAPHGSREPGSPEPDATGAAPLTEPTVRPVATHPPAEPAASDPLPTQREAPASPISPAPSTSPPIRLLVPPSDAPARGASGRAIPPWDVAASTDRPGPVGDREDERDDVAAPAPPSQSPRAAAMIASYMSALAARAEADVPASGSDAAEPRSPVTPPAAFRPASPSARPAPPSQPATTATTQPTPAGRRPVSLVFSGIQGYQQASALELAISDLLPDGDVDVVEFERGQLVLSVHVADLRGLAEQLVTAAPASLALDAVTADRATFRCL